MELFETGQICAVPVLHTDSNKDLRKPVFHFAQNRIEHAAHELSIQMSVKVTQRRGGRKSHASAHGMQKFRRGRLRQ